MYNLLVNSTRVGVFHFVTFLWGIGLMISYFIYVPINLCILVRLDMAVQFSFLFPYWLGVVITNLRREV